VSFPVQPSQTVTLTLTTYTGSIGLNGLQFTVSCSPDAPAFPAVITGTQLPNTFSYDGASAATLDVDLMADMPPSPFGTPSGWQPAPHKTFSTMSSTHFYYTWWEGTARLDVVIS
jgi:hypothetical protein